MIEIKHRHTDKVIFSGEFASVKDAVEEAVKLGVSLTEANLTGADLVGADLVGANLTWANLTGADLIKANLFNANLTRADLTRANLTEANLYASNLTRANLTRANLTGANLIRTDLTGANLTEADLTRADLYVLCADFIKGLDIQVVSLGRRHRIVRVGDQVKIGCEEHSLGFWLENYEKIGTQNGYTPDEVFDYGVILKSLAQIRQRKLGEK